MLPPSRPTDRAPLRSGCRPCEDESIAERLMCVHPFLHTINRRRGSPLNEHDIDDLAQDTLLVLLRKVKTFEQRSTLETWAYRICMLEYLNRLRTVRRRRLRFTPLASQPEPATETTLEHDDERELLVRTLATLSSVRETIVRRRQFGQQSFGLIASVLGLPRSTVRTHYYRALTLLRSRLVDVEQPSPPHLRRGGVGPQGDTRRTLELIT